MKKKKIKALTFDTGGTILDWHSGFKGGFNNLKSKYNFNYNSEEMANLMRRKSLDLITTQGGSELINFDEAHKIAVDSICEEASLSLSLEEKKYLYEEAPSLLNVWPDFLEPFNELKNIFLCVSFTLLSNRLVFTNSKRNKINWDLVLSCETLGIYKPNIEAYKKTAKMLQLEPDECAMVACHSFDLNAAKKAGFNTIFVKRPLEWGKDTIISVDGDYNEVVDTFSEILPSLDNF